MGRTKEEKEKDRELTSRLWDLMEKSDEVDQKAAAATSDEEEDKQMAILRDILDQITETLAQQVALDKAVKHRMEEQKVNHLLSSM